MLTMAVNHTGKVTHTLVCIIIYYARVILFCFEITYLHLSYYAKYITFYQ